MPIFISHRQADSEEAAQLHRYFTSKDILAYVDLLEPGLKTDREITDKIRERLGQCTHLMAVVSENTKGSWWVPFEIGVATEKDNRISTLTKVSVVLPEYLSIWPVLHTQQHLDAYVDFYKSDKAVLVKQGWSQKAATASVQTASDFHRKMKAFLGQR